MAQAMSGYNGFILRANLSNNSLVKEAIEESFCRKYLGGAGFIAYYLWKELEPGIDALSPDNKLIFALGKRTSVTMGVAALSQAGPAQ